MSRNWLFLGLGFLCGCQVMSEKECRTADWYQTGYQDGRGGEPRSRIEDIIEACSKANVAPDQARYFSGRERGLLEYCTPDHGYQLGKGGSSLHQVCPPESAARFEAAYREGRKIYDARHRVDDLESRRHRLEDELAKAKSDADRRHIRDELSETDSDLREARDALRSIESIPYYGN